MSSQKLRRLISLLVLITLCVPIDLGRGYYSVLMKIIYMFLSYVVEIMILMVDYGGISGRIVSPLEFIPFAFPYFMLPILLLFYARLSSRESQKLLTSNQIILLFSLFLVWYGVIIGFRDFYNWLIAIVLTIVAMAELWIVVRERNNSN